MKKLLTLIAAVLCAASASAQIATFDPNKKSRDIPVYDSTKMQLLVPTIERMQSIVGQDITIIGSYKKYGDGYEYFYDEINPQKIYSPIDESKKNKLKTKSAYSSLANKVFHIVDVIIMPTNDPYNVDNEDRYFKLVDINTNKVIYYKVKTFSFPFPFIINGFLEKIKSIYANQRLVRINRNYRASYDPVTGAKISISAGDIFEFYDVAIADDSYMPELKAILKNERGEFISAAFMWNLSKDTQLYDYILLSDFEKLQIKYGNEVVDKAINGIIKIGMPKELVELCWGKPEKKNKASYGEQWVYNGTYIYFENGVVSGWN